MAAKIAISYRRADSDAIMGRIRDHLSQHFGDDAVFSDIDNIPLGVDYRRYVQDILSSCKVLLAIVGRNWTGKTNGSPARIQDKADPVRIEVETAMRRATPLIPILVGGAEMPDARDLPESLRQFPFLNAAQVSAGIDFLPDMDRLVHVLESILKSDKASAVKQANRRFDRRLLAVIFAACVIFSAAGAYYYHHEPNRPDPSQTPNKSQSPSSASLSVAMSNLHVAPLTGDRVRPLQGHTVIGNSDPTFPDGARISLELAHNLGPQKITIRSITPIVSYAGASDPRLAYAAPSGGVGGRGLAAPRQFVVRLYGEQQPSAAWIDGTGQWQPSSSANLLDTEPPLLLRLDAQDSTEDLAISIFAMTPGTYRVAFEIHYSVGAVDQETRTQSIVISKKAD